MKKLIDYSEYIVRRVAPLVEDSDGEGGLYPDFVGENEIAEEHNKKYFYGTCGYCPSCGWWEIVKEVHYSLPTTGYLTTQECPQVTLSLNIQRPLRRVVGHVILFNHKTQGGRHAYLLDRSAVLDHFVCV
jgi:hypothetical protein